MVCEDSEKGGSHASCEKGIRHAISIIMSEGRCGSLADYVTIRLFVLGRLL